VLGDEQCATVALWKTFAAVEVDAERGDVGAQSEYRRRKVGAVAAVAELGVAHTAGMAVRKTEVLAAPADAVDLVVRAVVAQPVAAVVAEPQLPAAGLPVEAHRVADAQRLDAHVLAVRTHAGEPRVAGPVTDVARRANGHVQTRVGTEGNVLQAVMAVAGQRVGDGLRLAGIGQPRRDVRVAKDA